MSEQLPEGIENCDYSSPEMRQSGKNYPEIDREIHGHIITGTPDVEESPFCMNTDLNKNEINTNTVRRILSGELIVPIYVLVCHGTYLMNVSMTTLENGETHYYPDSNSSYTLGQNQFVVNTTPFGSISMIGPTNARDMEQMFDAETQFKLLNTLFSDRFLETFVYKNTYAPSGRKRADGEDIPIEELAENSMYSPPLYEAFDKVCQFNDAKRANYYGIYQLNKNYDGVHKSIPTEHLFKYPMSLPAGRKSDANCVLNSLIPGIYVENQDAEREFVEYLKANDYKIRESEILRMFGDGIYIQQNCSPVYFTLNNTNNGDTISFVDDTHFRELTSNLWYGDTHLSIFKSICSELETIAYNLNLRWYEMVQDNPISPDNLYNITERGFVTKYYKDYAVNDHIENVDDYMGAMGENDIVNFRAILKRINVTDRYSYFNYVLGPLRQFFKSLGIQSGGMRKSANRKTKKRGRRVSMKKLK
jgi:hypothetical protein